MKKVNTLSKHPFTLPFSFFKLKTTEKIDIFFYSNNYRQQIFTIITLFETHTFNHVNFKQAK